MIGMATAALLTLAVWEGGQTISLHCGAKDCSGSIAGKLCPHGYDVKTRRPYRMMITCHRVWVIDVAETTSERLAAPFSLPVPPARGEP